MHLFASISRSKLLACGFLFILVVAAPCQAVGQYAEFKLTDLGTIENLTSYEDKSGAFALNDLGQVVGWSVEWIDDLPRKRAVIWLPEPAYGRPAGMHSLGILGGSASGQSEAHDINEHGHVVGQSSISGGQVGFIWVPPPPGSTEPGIMHGLPGGYLSNAWAVDDGDPVRVIGVLMFRECPTNPSTGQSDAFVWLYAPPKSTVETLPASGLFTGSGAYAINNVTDPANRVIGGYSTYCGDNPNPPCGDFFQAQQWGLMPELMDVIPPFGEMESEVWDVNAGQQLVGWGTGIVSGNCFKHAAFWDPSQGIVVDLHATAPFAGEPSTYMAPNQDSVGLSISESGTQVIGYNEQMSAALRWSDNSGWVVEDLQDRVPASCLPDFNLKEARDINELGWIVGTMVVSTDATHAFLLTPMPACPEDVVNQDGDVGTPDLLAVLGGWGDCVPGAFCTGDVDGDFKVGVSDLLAILDHWGPCGAGPQSPPQAVQDCINTVGYGNPAQLEACISSLPE